MIVSSSGTGLSFLIPVKGEGDGGWCCLVVRPRRPVDTALKPV